MSSKQQEKIRDSERDLTEAGQAWEELSSILMDTPLDISPDWLDQVQSRWGAEPGHLILHVPASTDPLWLKRKFLPVANVFFSQLQGGQGQDPWRRGRPLQGHDPLHGACGQARP